MEQIKQKDLQKYKIGKYGIKIKVRDWVYDEEFYIESINRCNSINVMDCPTNLSEKIDISHIIPILRPLTDLYKPMENGEIPIVELAKIAYPKCEWRLSGKYAIDYYKAFTYRQGIGFVMCLQRNICIMKIVYNQYKLFDWLYEHHFWLGDQSYFEKGLIIDKNTVK